MRISDWSSDVCSSDLGTRGGTETNKKARAGGEYIDLLLIARGKGGQYIGRLVAQVILNHQMHALRCQRPLQLPGKLAARFVVKGVVEIVQILVLATRLEVQYRSGLCRIRSEEHTSELQSLMRSSYAVFCLKKKKKTNNR